MMVLRLKLMTRRSLLRILLLISVARSKVCRLLVLKLMLILIRFVAVLLSVSILLCIRRIRCRARSPVCRLSSAALKMF